MLTKNLAPINIMFAGGTLKSTIPYLTERNRAKVVPLASMSYDLSCNTKFLQTFNGFGDISNIFSSSKFDRRGFKYSLFAPIRLRIKKKRFDFSRNGLNATLTI